MPSGNGTNGKTAKVLSEEKKVGKNIHKFEKTIGSVAFCVGLGLTNEQAASACGIARSTLQEWLKKPECSDIIKKAKDQRLVRRLEKLESMPKNWQAIAWLLERTVREQFKPPMQYQKTEHTGEVSLAEVIQERLSSDKKQQVNGKR